MKKNEIIYFMHIAKSGGTTFKKIPLYNYSKCYALNNRIEAGINKEIKVQRLDSEGTNEEISLRDIKNNKKFEDSVEYLYGRDISFGIHEYFTKGFKYITFLREPVDRVISYYYYAAYKHNLLPSRSEYEYFKKIREMTFEEYIIEGPNNFQTRLVSGKGGVFEDAFNDFEDNINEEDFKRAISNIDKHFAFVGIREEYDKSLLLLKQKIGWNSIYYTSENVNLKRPKKEEISEKIIDIIEEKNAYDIRLYEYVKKVFNKEIKNYKGDIEKDLREFGKNNQIYSIGYKNGYKNGQLDKEVIVDRYKDYYELLSRWVNSKNEGKNLVDNLKKCNYKNIAIYGMGNLGKILYKELRNSDVKILYAIDSNVCKNDDNELKYISLEEIKDLFNNSLLDAIIVTPVYDFDFIKGKLKILDITVDIISLSDIVSSI